MHICPAFWASLVRQIREKSHVAAMLKGTSETGRMDIAARIFPSHPSGAARRKASRAKTLEHHEKLRSSSEKRSELTSIQSSSYDCKLERRWKSKLSSGFWSPRVRDGQAQADGLKSDGKHSSHRAKNSFCVSGRSDIYGYDSSQAINMC
jgi:hypothetical protein